MASTNAAVMGSGRTRVMRGSAAGASGRKPLDFAFAAMVGGFRSDSPEHADLYASQESYALPSLHIMGRSDVVVPIEDSRVLSGHFTSARRP